MPKLNLVLALICKDYLAEKARQDPTYILVPVLLDVDNPQCRIPEVQSLASQFMLYMTVITGILSAIMSPKLGAWSDRYGRTRFLALSSAGLFLSEIVTILAASFPDHVNYRWLFAGAVFDGMFGSFTASMSTTFAYASDCTPASRRAVAFSYFHACLFSGIALGPLVAALLLKLTGNVVLLFYFVLGANIIFVAFILLVVPESLTQKRQKMARASFAASKQPQFLNPRTCVQSLRALFEPLSILWPTESGSSAPLRRNMALLAMVDTISFGVAMSAMTVIVYYVGFQFGWDSKQTSLFMSTTSTSRVTGLLVILPILNHFLFKKAKLGSRIEQHTSERHTGSDVSELIIVRFALLIEVIGFGGYALASRGATFVLFGVVAALGGIASPTLQGALTKHVPPDRVGQLLGATGLLHALARVGGPAAANFVYAKTVKSVPQTIFYLLSASFGLAFLCSCFIQPNGTRLSWSVDKY